MKELDVADINLSLLKILLQTICLVIFENLFMERYFLTLYVCI